MRPAGDPAAAPLLLADERFADLPRGFSGGASSSGSLGSGRRRGKRATWRPRPYVALVLGLLVLLSCATCLALSCLPLPWRPRVLAQHQGAALAALVVLSAGLAIALQSHLSWCHVALLREGHIRLCRQLEGLVALPLIATAASHCLALAALLVSCSSSPALFLKLDLVFGVGASTSILLRYLYILALYEVEHRRPDVLGELRSVLKASDGVDHLEAGGEAALLDRQATLLGFQQESLKQLSREVRSDLDLHLAVVTFIGVCSWEQIAVLWQLHSCQVLSSPRARALWSLSVWMCLPPSHLVQKSSLT